MIALWIILALVVVLVIYVIALYNGLVQKRNRVDNSWAQIEVQLKRRRDLIPNLVETVKGYAAHERGTFEAVTQARAAAAGAQGAAQTAAAEGMLTQALGRLFAVAEAYPDLKASTNFLDLQTQLRDTEDKIAVSRQVYNDTVLTFNNGIQVFPAVLIAGMFGFTKREFFEIEDAADREVPVVSFQPRRCRKLPPRQLPPPAMRLRLRRVAALLAAALAALAITGTAGAKSFTLPQADVSVQVAKNGSLVVDEQHHLRLQRAVQRRLPRDPAPHRASRSPTSRVSENGRGLPPGRLHRARLQRRPRHLRCGQPRQGRPDRLALPGARRAPHLRRPLPAERRRRRLRRRRRRQPPGLGLGVEAVARTADGGRDGAGQDPPRLGPSRLRSGRRPAGRHAGRPPRAERPGRAVRRAPHGDPPRGVHARRSGCASPRARGWRRSSPPRPPMRPASRRTSERIDNAKQHPWRYALYLLLLGTCRRSSSSAASSGSTAASCGPATTASTSRSRPPRRSRRSCRRCCGRAARPARSSSPRRCST